MKYINIYKRLVPRREPFWWEMEERGGERQSPRRRSTLTFDPLTQNSRGNNTLKKQNKTEHTGSIDRVSSELEEKASVETAW